MENTQLKNGIKRKCGCCGETFYINKNNINEAIYYDKKTYHIDCFYDICNKRSKYKRKDVSQKWTWILNNIDSIKADTYSHLMSSIVKEDIFNFIKESYDITIIPTTIWQKLNDIYSGTFKGMSIGIPPSHLFDMWKKKIDMLNGIDSKNKTKGIHMKTDQRISYDLSILVNKYDSYVKWLEKQRILEVEKTTERSDNIVSKSIGYTASIQKEYNPNDDDISDLVDDIFR